MLSGSVKRHCLFLSLITKTNVLQCASTASPHISSLTAQNLRNDGFRFSGKCYTYPWHQSKRRLHHKMEYSGISLPNIVRLLESFAPSSLAEKWDNVGLLLAPEQGSEGLIRRVLLTNDLTEDVLMEAVDANVNLIISYHPPLFEAVKRITSSTWKGRIIQTCLRKDIAIYSPHTSWDAVADGVNDWLIKAFDAFGPESEPILQSFQPNELATHMAEAVVPKRKSSSVIEKIKQSLGVNNLGEIPYNTGEDEIVKITIPCKTKDIVPLTCLLQVFPHTFTKLEENPVLNYGMGRKCVLSRPPKLTDAVNAVKSHLGLPDVSLALARGADMDTVINTVAVCAGSGGTVLQKLNADLIVTGEMSHHQVLDSVHQGVNVILTRHSNSERGFLKHFASTFLNDALGKKVELILSTKDKDPLSTL